MNKITAANNGHMHLVFSTNSQCLLEFPIRCKLNSFSFKLHDYNMKDFSQHYSRP